MVTYMPATTDWYDIALLTVRLAVFLLSNLRGQARWLEQALEQMGCGLLRKQLQRTMPSPRNVNTPRSPPPS